ncbi:hypothetical protein TDB9533_01553 [Thalassocella blandensis]|nr:hypothetical protein TDB9533_01553 [Thalassocella blandensis]
MDAIWLGLAALTTSTIAGVFGLGGGMLLIAIVPMLLAPQAIIPVHGTAQLASNASRGVFAFRAIAWDLFPRFLLGSLLGISLVALFLRSIPLTFIPLLIGIYILSRLWLPILSKKIERFENMVIVGAVQTGLGLVVGATGPLTTTILAKRYENRDIVVATNAVMMSISHLAKVLVYVFLGFSFLEYWREIIALVVGATAGSYLGTKIRTRIDDKRFFTILQVLLSLLAIKMITTAVLSSI